MPDSWASGGTCGPLQVTDRNCASLPFASLQVCRGFTVRGAETSRTSSTGLTVTLLSAGSSYLTVPVDPEGGFLRASCGLANLTPTMVCFLPRLVFDLQSPKRVSLPADTEKWRVGFFGGKGRT